MQIIYDPDTLTLNRKSGVTIGNFDGVHKGHQALIRRTLEACREKELICVLVTFWPHPRLVVNSNGQHCPLSTRERRLELLAQLGVEYVIELPFTHEMANLQPEAFVEQYLLPLQMRYLVIGYDFTLGRKRSGNFAVLQALGQRWHFDVEQVAPLLYNGCIVSSSRLRTLLTQGAVSEAAKLLGYHYGFTGQIVHGVGRGRVLGFPTANLELPDILLPMEGVYATLVHLGQQTYSAVTNIGHNPTFKAQHLSVESFLLDTEQNLYGQTASLEFIERLRGEQTFASVDALKQQISADIILARRILEERQRSIA